MMISKRTTILLCTVVAISCTNNESQPLVGNREEESPPQPTAPASGSPGMPAGAGSSTPPANPQIQTRSPDLPHRTSCKYFAGKALAGQGINLDVCSIQPGNLSQVPFVYYLGNDRVESSANCLDQTWTTYPENQVHTPQSGATEKMLTRVCQG